jgi:NADPH:quinone reductase-like Zn-dependent oxidoreductase
MKLMSGTKFPKHTGADFAGTLEDIGSSVSSFRLGDEVFGVVKNLMKEGASAEYIAAPASLVWKKPADISFAQAASIPVVGSAAITALEKMGNVTSQTKVLVNGATGGFGMFLLQLLKQRGTNVTAVSGTHGVDSAKRWGATTVVDYNRENVLFQKTAYDIIIDLSGKMGYKNARQIMKSEALFLNPTPRPLEIPTSILNNFFTAKKHIAILSNPSDRHANVLLSAVKSGLDVEVNKTFPFAQFKEAYQYAERGGYIGKVVIEIY